MKELLKGTGWEKLLEGEFSKPYFKQLEAFLEEEWKGNHPIYPPKHQIFQALEKTPSENLKVVIIGQDPYHGKGQAEGLCFSVAEGVTPPPSLKNIFKEIEEDLMLPRGVLARRGHGSLLPWAKQGVLLLNATLTVREGEPGSHQNKGWEVFTDEIVRIIDGFTTPVVFMLWGRFAKQKCETILKNKNHHLILTSAHPSPFSATDFFGCHHFSKANAFLAKNGRDPIEWA